MHHSPCLSKAITLATHVVLELQVIHFWRVLVDQSQSNRLLACSGLLDQWLCDCSYDVKHSVFPLVIKTIRHSMRMIIFHASIKGVKVHPMEPFVPEAITNASACRYVATCTPGFL